MPTSPSRWTSLPCSSFSDPRSGAGGRPAGRAEQPGQISCGSHVVGKAKGRPPGGYARVRYELAVDQVENAMRSERDDDKPQICPEAEDCHEKKRCNHQRFPG